MSDLGAIFHVKKDGTQYDAHAYTTEDECPSPNLKIKTKDGTQAYVKLTDNGSGDVPLRVKPKSSGTTYQVKSEAIPTGSVILYYSEYGGAITIPAGVNVVYNGNTSKLFPSYIGVTPGKTYTLVFKRESGNKSLYNYSSNATWYYRVRLGSSGSISSTDVKLSWSPEINKQTPTVTDY